MTVRVIDVSMIQFIRTKRELLYEELKGRYTQLMEDVPGFIIDENTIDSIRSSDEQISDCFSMLETANLEGKTLALVQGRLCILDEADFYRCDPPKIYPVTNKIS